MPDNMQVEGYAVRERLGAGGFGEVYAAHSVNGDDVVLKFVPKAPGAERELLFEGINGQNVLPVLKILSTDSHYVLVMPRAEYSLYEALHKAGGCFQEAEAVKVLQDVTAALASLEGTVVHRDLKPENVLFWEGRWCLADFGIARYAEAVTADVTFKFAGTTPYMAPERWRRERATIKSDVYSLGIMAFEMLEGVLPFTGDAADLVKSHLQMLPPTMSKGTAPYQQFVMDCMAKAPEARPTPARLLLRLAGLQERQAGGLAALQAASLHAARQAAESSTEASKQQSEAERQQSLFQSATVSLAGITHALQSSFETYAPSSQISTSRSLLEIRLGQGILQLSGLEKVNRQKTQIKYGQLPFEVVAAATISVVNNPPLRDYRGRQHSLWFGDLEQQGDFRWYELAFCVIWGQGTPFTPMGLSPTNGDAVGAVLVGLHTYQVARTPVAIDQGDHEEFVQRWAGWLAAASTGDLGNPSVMPEESVRKIWRQ